MLKHLFIQNYALIEHLDLDLYSGFNIITGETGAGKSILLGALSLILGTRADSSAIKQGAEQCVVEATFDIQNYGLEEFFESQDLEYSSELLIRRQVSSTGKSRAFVNDTPVNLLQLKAISERLIDIHSQHANLFLQDAPFQLLVLDSFAANEQLLNDYSHHYTRWVVLKDRIVAKVREHEQLAREKEELALRLEELTEARLQSQELEQLEIRQKTLAHVEELRAAYGEVLEILEGDTEGSVLSQLKTARMRLERIRDLHPHAEELVGRLETTTIELHDLAQEASGEWKTFPEDTTELVEVEARLILLERLLKKYHCKTCDELITLKATTEQTLAALENFDFDLQALNDDLQALEKTLYALAQQLTEKRNEKAQALSEQIQQNLQQLGIPEAVFEVRLIPQAELTPAGAETIEFLFTAHRQLTPMPLARVASGGEMARVMLSLKAIMAHSLTLPTIIFDEIDTGVSGSVAAQMGNMLQRMAADLQILNITHLPQIASRGEHHFLVYKEQTHAGETVSNIRLLTDEERVVELAKLLSGEQVTALALENARELLRNAQYEAKCQKKQ